MRCTTWAGQYSYVIPNLLCELKVLQIAKTYAMEAVSPFNKGG